jgi:hypothetical protein
MKRLTLAAVFAAVIVAVPSAQAPTGEESLSAGPAATLRAALEGLKLDAIVARDPEAPGRYIAALYIPGSQLLVVSAPYSAPALLDKKIAQSQYRDAYVDLQSVSDHTGHFFVVDMGADGLIRVCGRDEAFDSTTFESRPPVSFDGNWIAQQLTEEEYTAAFRKDDERYARLLKVLAAAVARKTS